MILILIIFNICFLIVWYVQLWNDKHCHPCFRRDSTMTALLTCIIVVFIICHSSKVFTNLYEAYLVGTQWDKDILCKYPCQIYLANNCLWMSSSLFNRNGLKTQSGSQSITLNLLPSTISRTLILLFFTYSIKFFISCWHLK